MRRTRRAGDNLGDRDTVARVLQAWERLAPAGNDLEARRAELRHIGRELLHSQGRVASIDALDALQTIHVHQVEAAWSHQARDVRRTWLQLTADARQLFPALKQRLHAARQLHRVSASHKWYGLGDGDAGRWRRSAAAYEHTLTALEQDPLFIYLRQRPFKSAARGNPDKTRNKRLRSALTGCGLSRQQITIVLAAIQFTTGQPVGKSIRKKQF
jgi:hypothetical protein